MIHMCRHDRLKNHVAKSSNFEIFSTLTQIIFFFAKSNFFKNLKIHLETTSSHYKSNVLSFSDVCTRILACFYENQQKTSYTFFEMHLATSESENFEKTPYIFFAILNSYNKLLKVCDSTCFT